LLNVENLQVDSKEKRVIKQAIKKFSIAKNIFFSYHIITLLKIQRRMKKLQNL